MSNAGAIVSGNTGSTRGYMFATLGLGVDGCGNVWLLAPAGLLQCVGAGTPVVTPFSVGVQNGTLGMRP